MAEMNLKNIPLSEEEQKYWQQEVSRSRVNIKEKYHDKWSNNYLEYNNNWAERDEDKIIIESLEAFKMIYVLMPQLIFKNPEIVAKPLKNATNRTVNIKKSLLNKCWDISNSLKEAKRILLDTFLSVGVGYIGYDCEYAVSPKQTTVKERINILEQMAFLFNSQTGDIPEEIAVELDKLYKENGDLTISVLNENIIKEMPFLKRIDPFKFLVDRHAVSRENALWMGYDYYVKPKEALKQYPQLKEQLGSSEEFAKKGLVDRIISGEKVYLGNEERSERESEMVRFTHIFYKSKDEYGNFKICEMLLCEDFEKPLFNRFCPIAYRRLPFELLNFFEDPMNFFPIPAVEVIKQHTKLITIMQNKLLASANSIHSKYFIDDRIYNKDTKKKLQAAEDCIIPLNRTNIENLNNLIIPVAQDTSKIRVLAEVLGMIESKTEQILGVTQESMGGGRSSRATATEAAIRDKHLALKVGLLEGQVDDFIKEVTRTFNMIIDQMYRMDDYVEIMGEDGVPQLVEFNMQDGIKSINGVVMNELDRNELKSELFIDIEAGSTGIYNEDLKSSKNLQFYQMAINNPTANPFELGVWMAKEMGINEEVVNKLFNAQVVSPDEEFMELFKTGVMPDPQPTEDFTKHIAKHSEQIQILDNLVQDNNMLLEIQQAIMQHIMMTEQLAERVTGKPIQPSVDGKKEEMSIQESPDGVQLNETAPLGGERADVKAINEGTQGQMIAGLQN